MLNDNLRRFISKLTRTSAVSYFVFYALTASADQYHFNSTLIGDRAAGLGGAYVAISDDPTGMYYNPAGMVYASGNNLSGSMNAMQLSVKNYRNVMGPGRDWKRTSWGLIPNFFGVTQKLGPGYFGVSYTVPDASIENQDQTFRGVGQYNDLDFHVNFNNQDYTYNVGPSYAIPLAKNLSLGLTLYGHYKTQELIFNQTFINTVDSKTYEWTNVYLQYRHAGIRPILGIMYSPIEKLSIGATITKPFLLYVDALEQYSQLACLNDGGKSWISCNNTPSITFSKVPKSNIALDSELPTAFNIGAAYFTSHALLFTMSMTYNTPMIGNYSVINYAAGTEYFVVPTVAIRVGLFTDFSATPPLTQGVDSGYNEHINLYGTSLSVTSFSRSSSLTIGLSSSTGQGQSQIINDGVGSLQAMDMFSISVYMSALYSF